MKKLVEDMATSHAISTIEAETYRLKANQSNQECENDEDHEDEDFWPSTMELIASKKVSKQALHEVGDCIRLETLAGKILWILYLLMPTLQNANIMRHKWRKSVRGKMRKEGHQKGSPVVAVERRT